MDSELLVVIVVVIAAYISLEMKRLNSMPPFWLYTSDIEKLSHVAIKHSSLVIAAWKSMSFKCYWGYWQALWVASPMALKLVPGKRSWYFLTLCAVILIVMVYLYGVLIPFVVCVIIWRSEIMLLRQIFCPKIQENCLTCVILVKKCSYMKKCS